MRIEARLMFRPIGLVDDIVVFATPAEYLTLAREVSAAAESETARVVSIESEMPIELLAAIDGSVSEGSIEIMREDARSELFAYLDDGHDVPELIASASPLNFATTQDRSRAVALPAPRVVRAARC